MRGEVSESLLKVQTSEEILELFRRTYEERRANLSQYQRNGSLVRPWDFSPALVFTGLDNFTNRVKTIKVSMETLATIFLKRCTIIKKWLHFWCEHRDQIISCSYTIFHSFLPVGHPVDSCGPAEA